MRVWNHSFGQAQSKRTEGLTEVCIESPCTRAARWIAGDGQWSRAGLASVGLRHGAAPAQEKTPPDTKIAGSCSQSSWSVACFPLLLPSLQPCGAGLKCHQARDLASAQGRDTLHFTLGF